jgi:hypothetical protein
MAPHAGAMAPGHAPTRAAITGLLAARCLHIHEGLAGRQTTAARLLDRAIAEQVRAGAGGRQT